jgi:endonuclease YncB( thermonuclease family)/transposase-like protein
MGKRQSFTREFKFEAVHLLRSAERTAAEVARELGVRRNQLYKWDEQFKVKGTDDVFPGPRRRVGAAGEIARLQRENARLQKENEIFKKAARYFARESITAIRGKLGEQWKPSPVTTHHVTVFSALLLALLQLPGCIGVSGDVSPQGVDQSEVVVAVPLDRSFKFRQPEDQYLKSRAGVLRAQVLNVHDGNTLTVRIDRHIEKVRLIGVNAPELTQPPWGQQARDSLKALVEEKTVRLETDKTLRDGSKRLLAYVYVGEMLVNLEMVRQGQAVIDTVPPNVAHAEEYRRAQAEAKEEGRGVWGPK